MSNDPLDSANFEKNPNRRDLGDARGGGWGVAIAIALVLAFGVFLMARAWRTENVDVARTASPAPSVITPRQINPDSAIPAAGVQTPDLTLTVLAEEPAKNYGKSVSIFGVVRNVIDGSAFTIATPEGTGETMVIIAQAVSPLPAQGQKVRVNGTFQAFDQGQVQQRLGDRFREEQFGTFADKPMIVAKSVQPMGDVGQ